MKSNKSLEQHIAVFGESGSGKTVLLSSFYGPTQEKGFKESNLYGVSADSVGQGARLHKNYLGMRDSAMVPETNRFTSTTYSFTMKPKQSNKKAKGAPFDSLRLVWHDYPGEWFEDDVSTEEEGQRRLDTFRSLLGSDVALLLVDAQRLLENPGEEDRYLKSLLANYHRGLELLKEDLLDNEGPLVDFPRIWVVALSKCDLLPGMDAFDFRDLVVQKAADDLDRLRDLIGEMVQGDEALTVGEDFVLLSSARFRDDRIEVTERVGLDLILPIAAALPFERHARWLESGLLPKKVAANLAEGAGTMAVALLAGLTLLNKLKVPKPVGVVLGVLNLVVTKDIVDKLAAMTSEKLKKTYSDALAQHQYLAAMLTRFRIELEKGEDAQVLLRSQR